MTNTEVKFHSKWVHFYLAFQRPRIGNRGCLRMVIRDEDVDLDVLELRCRLLGGTWRIHKTVNARDCDKALNRLMHKLIDNPEFASRVDSEWRSILLQRDCVYGETKFMLDVDTKDVDKIIELEELIDHSDGIVDWRVETPKGWHFITNGFDTRKVCELPYVTLLRDGYYFIKQIGGGTNEEEK